MGEPEPFQLGEGREEVLGEHPMGIGLLIELGPEPVVEVVGGVPAAVEDAVVLGDAVVVELVGGVLDGLPLGPTDRVHLVAGQRFGHENVVVHGNDVSPRSP